MSILRFSVIAAACGRQSLPFPMYGMVFFTGGGVEHAASESAVRTMKDFNVIDRVRCLLAVCVCLYMAAQRYGLF